jgi:hypothetical protein
MRLTRKQLTALLAAVVAVAAAMALVLHSAVADEPVRAAPPCTVDEPCTFVLSLKPRELVAPTTGRTPATVKAEFTRSAPHPVHLTATFSDACTGTAVDGLTANFAVNPIPPSSTVRLAIVTRNAAPGRYTLVLSGVAGTQRAAQSMVISVGGIRHC